MFIYAGNSLKNCKSDYQGIVPVPVVPLPLCCYHGLSYVEKAEVIRDRTSTKGLQLTLHLQGSGMIVSTHLPKAALSFLICGTCYSDIAGSLRRQRITMLKDLYFGITCQDVTSLLGTPSQVFYKSEDKMKIHSPNAHLHVKTPRRSDYFFNYFSLGLVSGEENISMITWGLGRGYHEGNHRKKLTTTRCARNFNSFSLFLTDVIK